MEVLRRLLLLLSATANSRGFVRVSESHYDHKHHTHHHHDPPPPPPHLADTNTTTSVYLGDTATLDCTVYDLGNQSVSWMRQVGDSLTLITWDSNTYHKDERYELVQSDSENETWQRWRLVIGSARRQDGGQYRCKVDTTPPLVMNATLTVIEPRARVVEERGRDVREKHYNSGSRIELKCIIDKIPFPPRPVIWRRGNIVLTFNTSRGGISVKGDAKSGFLSSRLYVTNASPSDSGVYSCWYHNYTYDTVTVHVIAGENWAGLQHDALPTNSSAPLSSASYLTVATCFTCMTRDGRGYTVLLSSIIISLITLKANSHVDFSSILTTMPS